MTLKSVIAKFRKELKLTFQSQKNIMDVTDKYLTMMENATTGGGGGSDVSVTQIVSTGTKIATITVDDTPTDLYAFSGNYNDLSNKPDIPDVSVTQVQSTGTKIATITVDSTSTDIYAPGGSGGSSAATDVSYDNTSSGLAADDVQEAIDELASEKSDKSDLASISETGSTASQTISSGTYFYLNGSLVRAIADISSESTFTLNTNYKVVTAGALNEIGRHKLNASSIISAYSGFTLVNSNVYEQDGVITINISGNLTTASTEAYVITIASGYRPVDFGSVGSAIGRTTNLTTGNIKPASLTYISNGNVYFSTTQACGGVVGSIQVVPQ